jgi:hypothetical protein
MKTTTKVRVGALGQNHSQAGIRVQSAVKAGAITSNHNQTGISPARD